MAAKRYCSKMITGDNWQEIFVTGSNTDNTVTIHVVNHNSVSIKVSLALIDSTNINDFVDSDIFVIDFEIPARAYDFWRGIAIPAQHMLAAYSSENLTSLLVYGYEEDNAD